MTRHRARPLAAAFLACAMIGALPGAAYGAIDRQTPTATAPTARGAGDAADTLLVRLRPGVPEAAARSLFAAAGATEVGRLEQLGVSVVEAPGLARSAVRDALRENPAVLSVESDGVGRITLEPNDTKWPYQWASRKVRSPRAWDVTTGAGGPIIAILDTGVAAGHPDLEGRVLAGRDFVNGDKNAADDNGHGTLVAGVAAARGMNDVGVAGTCWRCQILPVKVINSHGEVRWSNAAAGLIWATDRGAQVINMSFGAFSGNSTLASAVKYAVDRGVVVIGAAGNNGRSTKFYPAAYPGVLSVAATTSDDRLYSWSNRGQWVKLAAPGCNWTTRRGGGWTSFCGTSASAPMVAGIAGLILSIKPGASALRIKGAIRSTSVYFTWRINGGRADAWAALNDFR